MTQAGRKPEGPALARHLEGSPRAKERLEVILETIAGHLSIAQACARLGIGPAMFFRLRNEVLEAGLARLEPQPLGRPAHAPSPESQRCSGLERRIEDLEAELRIAAVREEVARVLPHRDKEQAAVKKTTAGKSRKRRCPRGRRQGH